MNLYLLTKSASVTPGIKVFYVVLILIGLLAIVASIFNWDWYFNLGRTRRICNLFGRTAARIIQVIVGLFLIGLSIYIILNT
ncbi:MAG: hypothetical protein GX286_00410 [Clostridiales bacterium]|jgi:small neutral amino acid transporter SnatA (MarC family)|nr:hypothetical protein [Clostridiales bacterium]